MSTERLSKEPRQKRSIDCSNPRLRTDFDERNRPEPATVEIGIEELRELMGRLRALKEEKELLCRELGLYRRCLAQSPPPNAVLRALAPR